MKKLNIIFLVISILVLSAGCKKDFLEDMKSFDKYDESIFDNEVLTGWYIDRLYYDFFSGYRSPITNVPGLYNDTRTKSTEEIGGTITDYINSQKTLSDVDQADGYYGTALAANSGNTPYTRIRTANFLIQEIGERGKNLSQEFKDHAKGQMYFLRGLQYFALMRVYGGVPIVTTVQNATPDNPEIQVPRATPEELVKQITLDFDSAALLLPATWGAGDYGRYTSGAALAMKSRVLLTFASPLFNPDWDNSGNQRWKDALDAGLAAETALSSAGYGLYGNSAKDWGEMWYKSGNAFNKEAIMVQLFSSSDASSGILSNGWESSIRVANQGGSGGISAPKEMIDLFPMADGSRPTAADGYDPDHFFMNRDPRFYRTFAFSGMKWGYKESPNDVIWLYRWVYNTDKKVYSDGNQTTSPVVVRKMTNTPAASTVTGMKFSGTSIFQYRYAELLLNIAECYAATGDIGNALAYIGKIRARVGIPADNNYGVGTPSSKYEALRDVLYERRVELAYEGKRFWDIQRWMLYNDDPTADNTTCAKLGLDPINGTARTGELWQYKTIGTTNDDPLVADRTGIAVDPDASDFQSQLENLKTFFDNNIDVVNTDQPMDKDGTGAPAFIDFRQNYYISGLNRTALSLNPWLLQTIGWTDASNAPGTFNYHQ